MLGGVRIPHPTGLMGHSDADVLLHAITDAMLGALALPDIGVAFPDDDERYRDADSAVLLGEVSRRVRRRGWQVGNVDCVLVCDTPRLAQHFPIIRERLAALLNATPDCIGLKAKTTEGTMLARPQRSIAALAVVLLVQK